MGIVTRKDITQIENILINLFSGKYSLIQRIIKVSEKLQIYEKENILYGLKIKTINIVIKNLSNLLKFLYIKDNKIIKNDFIEETGKPIMMIQIKINIKDIKDDIL